jgi:hypothetical protein
MKPHMVRIKMVKDNLCLYYVEPFDFIHKDFMVQAAEMAKPYIKEGWKLVHAMMVDFNY